ncbi:MAG: T9SS type A sorting domain-containing protein [bacterium]|nr:MAG: T9SS type A sorting domain-containing protein [bacterium]
MKIARYIILGIFMMMFLFGVVLSQQTGDYRSAATGNWSAASTWETYNGSTWVAASSAPTGLETITVDDLDSVSVDVAVTIGSTGYIIVTSSGEIVVTTGSLTFGNGSTYEHARNGGVVPISTWGTGSTALYTGITSSTPSNRGQDYYHLVLNTPGLSSNRDMDLVDVTIGGDITVVNTGSSRWRMVGSSSTTIAIMGDVNIQAGAFETQGTSSPTIVEVNHYGDFNITGGTFGISRGSQGSGTGTTTWNLFGGNLSVSNAELRNSNPTPGNAKFVFAGADTQQISFNTVTYGGGDIHFKVADSSTMQITQAMEFNGLVVNEGAIDAVGTPTFIDGSVYEHARDGGDVPTAVWDVGSTALFTGITANTPGNRGQDYYHLTLNTPGLLSNRDMGLVDVTIGGDITVISSGTARWRMVGGDSSTITVMGDVIVQGGSFETQGTSSPTVVEVHHYGNVNVTAGIFSVSRGSQGNGTGSTRWFMHQGDFSISDAETRNSNPTNAWFVFDDDTMQAISLTNVTYGGGGLPIVVANGATLDFGLSELGGSGLFTLNTGATLATANEAGVDSTIKSTGDVVFSDSANYVFNGTVAQITGFLMPDTLMNLTIADSAGVTLSQETYINGVLRLVAGVFDNTIPFTLGPNASISYEGGSLLIPVGIEEPASEIPKVFALYQNYPNPFNPATTIRYAVPRTSQVVVKIYDILGREVAELVNDQQNAGEYDIIWNAQKFASGIYYYRMTAGDFVSVKKLVLMK